jgi:hypothetical protein
MFFSRRRKLNPPHPWRRYCKLPRCEEISLNCSRARKVLSTVSLLKHSNLYPHYSIVSTYKFPREVLKAFFSGDVAETTESISSSSSCTAVLKQCNANRDKNKTARLSHSLYFSFPSVRWGKKSGFSKCGRERPRSGFMRAPYGAILFSNIIS